MRPRARAAARCRVRRRRSERLPLSAPMELIREPKPGDEIDARTTMYPSRLRVVDGELSLDDPATTYYGYVVRGQARVHTKLFDAAAHPGTFFCVPGPGELRAEGLVVVIERLGYRGLPQLGSIEAEGRLAYIDGCSDTVLVAPARLGDPVLNFLHFPPGIEQSLHSHPSLRLGVVARGGGEAYGPSPRGEEWQLPLAPGSVFMLAPHERHAFRTTHGKSSMDVIAYHPDSDWGPTDAAHPMLNRTYRR